MGKKYEGVISRSAGSITIDFRYRGKRCRETLRLQPTPGNLKKAANFRARIIDAIEQGTFDYAQTFPNSKNAEKFPRILDSRNRTVADYVRQWLTEKQPLLKHSTFREYQRTMEYSIIPAVGQFLLVDLRRSDVRAWVSTLDVSNKRIANLISPLRVALEDAVQDELIPKNPLKDWGYKRPEAPAPSRIDPFTPDEQRAILAATNGQAKNLIQFAFWSGLRTSEIIALEWSDIDFEQGLVSVNKAITTASKHAESTKTKSGHREVIMLPPARSALESQFNFSGEEGGRVFKHPRTGGDLKNDQSIRKGIWKPALEASGVRYRYPYQTRHTFASMMLSAGEPLAWVSKQMGHSSVLVTAQVYARWVPSGLENAGSKAYSLCGDGL